jgi:dTDP-4-dehydrorhamnose 3,5-epimerase
MEQVEIAAEAQDRRHLDDFGPGAYDQRQTHGQILRRKLAQRLKERQGLSEDIFASFAPLRALFALLPYNVIFTATPLPGAFILELERHADERGFFARTWCREEFAARGLETALVQCSISWNAKRGTLRGLHYQAAPHEEVKLVRCTSGSIYDVILDLRPGSPTWRRWVAVELTADNRRQLYVPRGFGHGFQTLADDTEVFYQISTSYHPESQRGARWDDPAFGIRWPVPEPILSDRDRNFPLV